MQAAPLLTADAPVLGTRQRDVRNRFHLPSWLTLPNVGAGGAHARRGGG
ncbi:MAG: hypothetical protein R3F59_26490 [Myxococcota bacterium]